MKIARRIEKVNAEKMFAELRVITFGDLLQGNAAGIGGEDGAGTSHGCDAAEQLGLPPGAHVRLSAAIPA